MCDGSERRVSMPIHWFTPFEVGAMRANDIRDVMLAAAAAVAGSLPNSTILSQT